MNTSNIINNNDFDINLIKHYVTENIGDIEKIEPYFFQQYFSSVTDDYVYLDLSGTNSLIYGHITIDTISGSVNYEGRLWDINDNICAFLGMSATYTYSLNPLGNFFKKADFRYNASNLSATIKGYKITLKA